MKECDCSKVNNTPVPNTAGYPNNAPNTQTKVRRGNGAATKGTKMSKNSQ